MHIIPQPLNLLVMTIMKVPPTQCTHSMHGVYTHSCAPYSQYGIRKYHHAPVHIRCMQLVWLLNSCLWIGTGTTWDSHMPEAYYTLQQTLLRFEDLTLLYMTEPVWFTASPWFVLKSVHWPHGQLQDYGTKECTNVRGYSPGGSAI